MAARPKIIAGNWKMNTTLADAHVLADGVRNGIEHMDHITVVLCPPAIWLTELAHDGIPPRKLPHLKLGGQNMHFELSGAFTGEISPLMLKEVAEYVIIGHSERTHVFKENPELINNKLRAALDNELIPILCIGEDVQTAESGRQLVHKLNFLIRDFTPEELARLVVAYEPVWAIGSGNPATPEYAQTIISTLRTVLTSETAILYGGSVNEENAKAFLEQPDIDGFLIGGTSLKLKPFLTVCQLADDISIPSKH